MASTEFEAESQSLSGKETPAKNTEEVLIEREGKFELISASDMQADADTDPNTPESQPKFSKNSVEYASTDPKPLEVQDPGPKRSEDDHESQYSETWSNPDDQQRPKEDALAKPYTAETSEVTGNDLATTDDPPHDTAAKTVTANSEVMADTVPVTADSSKSDVTGDTVLVTAKSSKSDVAGDAVPVTPNFLKSVDTAKSDVAADTVPADTVPGTARSSKSEAADNVAVTAKSEVTDPVTAKSSKSEVAADTVPVTAMSEVADPVTTKCEDVDDTIPVTAKSEVAADTVPVTTESEVAADTVPVTTESEVAADTVPVTTESEIAADTVPVTAEPEVAADTVPVTAEAKVADDNLPVRANSSKSEVEGIAKEESNTVKPQASRITFKDGAAGSESFASNSSGRDSNEPAQFWNAKRRWQEAQMERKRRNEAAYNAWLVKKDNQIAEQRKIERMNRAIVTRDDLLHKMENCEVAYKAWLKEKNQKIHEKRLEDRATKSANLETTTYTSTLSFQMWLEQKQIQRQKERAIEMRRMKEEAEVEKKITPEDANLAYKR